MKYIPTLTITSSAQLHALPLQSGQWIQLAWLGNEKSRFESATKDHIRAFHNNGKGYVSYKRLAKACDAFVAFNRHARQLSMP